MMSLRSYRRFARDNRGVAAVEFAFVAPILIVFYLGMAETCQLLKAKRRVDHATAAIADLVTQEAIVTPAVLDQLKSISGTILEPLPSAPLTLQLTSVQDDINGAPKCLWGWPAACAPGSTPPMAIDTPLSAGESVVVAQVSYTYGAEVGYLITSGTTLRHKAELRPRRNNTVDCPTC